jgi:hypothetical protein
MQSGVDGRRRIAALALVSLSAVGCAADEPPSVVEPPLPYADLDPGAAHQAGPTLEHPLIILGDTQRTTLAEQYLLLREDNSAETPRLLEAVAREQPGLVAIVGDAVTWGSLESDWENFDRWMAPLRKNVVPVLLALGNHESGAAATAL